MPFKTGINDVDKHLSEGKPMLRIVAAGDSAKRRALMLQSAVKTAFEDKEHTVVFYSLELAEYPLSTEMYEMGISWDQGTLPPNFAIAVSPKTGNGIADDVRARNGKSSKVSTIFVDCFQKMEATSSEATSLKALFDNLVGSLADLADEGIDVVLSYDFRKAETVVEKIEPTVLRERAGEIIVLSSTEDGEVLDVAGTPVKIVQLDTGRFISCEVAPEESKVVEEDTGEATEADRNEEKQPEEAPGEAVKQDTGDETGEDMEEVKVEIPERIRNLAEEALGVLEKAEGRVLGEPMFKLNRLVDELRNTGDKELLEHGRGLTTMLFDFTDTERVGKISELLKTIAGQDGREAAEEEAADETVPETETVAKDAVETVEEVSEPEETPAGEGEAASDEAPETIEEPESAETVEEGAETGIATDEPVPVEDAAPEPVEDDAETVQEGEVAPAEENTGDAEVVAEASDESPVEPVAEIKEGRIRIDAGDPHYIDEAVAKANEAYRNAPAGAATEPARIVDIREELNACLSGTGDETEEQGFFTPELAEKARKVGIVAAAAACVSALLYIARR